MSVRAPSVAGTFYPGDSKELKRMIDKFLEEAEDVKIEGELKGLVEPHAGYVYSGLTAAYGYKLLSKNSEKINKVFLAGPSHQVPFSGAAESGFEFWETPLGKVKIGSVKEKAKKKDLFPVYPQVHAPEHCLEVQVPFLQTVLKDFTLYPLLISDANPEKIANEIAEQFDENSIFIASSDLSHYQSYDIAKKIDSTANEAVPSLDFKKFEAKGDACGKGAILVLMHLAKKLKWKGKLLDYRTSGDTAGEKDAVVGYGCYAFYE